MFFIINPLSDDVLYVSLVSVFACSACSTSHIEKIIRNRLFFI